MFFISLGLPQDKKTAADMYEKAALLGERGAEEEAKRLRKEIHRQGNSILKHGDQIYFMCALSNQF